MATVVLGLESVGPYVEAEEELMSYIERVEMFLAANQIDDDRKVPVFISLMGPKLYSQLKSLVTPDLPSSLTFSEITKVFADYLGSKPSVIYERYLFYKTDQSPTESVLDYVANLKRKTHQCEFGSFLEEALRDRLVAGVHNNAITKRLLTEKGLTFTKAVELAVSIEFAAIDTDDQQTVTTAAKAVLSKVEVVSSQTAPEAETTKKCLATRTVTVATGISNTTEPLGEEEEDFTKDNKQVEMVTSANRIEETSEQQTEVMSRLLRDYNDKELQEEILNRELSMKLRKLKDSHVARDGAQLDIKKGIVKYLVDLITEDNRGFIHKTEYVGSAYEGTQAGKSDDFDVICMINLKGPQLAWSVIDGGEPAYRTLKQSTKVLSSRDPRVDLISKLIDEEGRLSALKVRKEFQSRIDSFLEKKRSTLTWTTQEGEILPLSVERSRAQKAATTLTVGLTGIQSFTIDLVPTISHQMFGVSDSNVDFIAKPFNKKDPENLACAHLWKMSVSVKEKDRLQTIDKGNLVHRLVLKIYKLLRKSNSQLKMLPSYFYKNVLLHLSADGNLSWTDKDLADRFMDMAKEIMRHLGNGRLGAFFNEEENVLQGKPEQALLNVRNYVQGCLNKGVAGFMELVEKLPAEEITQRLNAVQL